MARTVARNGAQIMVTSLQRRDARTVILFADRLADVELVDLYAHAVRTVPLPSQVSLC
jgi:hypothetical protein